MRLEKMTRLLPEVIQRAIEPASPLAGFLAAMEGLHAPSERVLAELERFFDPRRTPDAFVPYLAGWVDLDLPVTTGLGRMRELISEAIELSHMRGTRKALTRFLTVATGVSGFDVDESPRNPDGTWRPFHIVVYAPRESLAHELMLRKIIEIEKPAHVTYELLPTPNPTQ